MAYARLFSSQLDPSAIEQFRTIFANELRPLFAQVGGCETIDLLVATEPNAGGLVEGCIIARWTTLDAIDAAYARDDVRAVAQRLLRLLRQEPVISVYEVLD